MGDTVRHPKPQERLPAGLQPTKLPKAKTDRLLDPLVGILHHLVGQIGLGLVERRRAALASDRSKKSSSGPLVRR